MLWGRLWRFDAFCQLGELDLAEAECEAIDGTADRMRSPLARWHALRSGHHRPARRRRAAPITAHAHGTQSIVDAVHRIRAVHVRGTEMIPSASVAR